MAEQGRSAVLDTNVLLLLLAGSADRSLFRTFKRIRTFDPPDYLILRALLREFGRVVTTPHVLAETSNFVDQAPPASRKALIAAFIRFVDEATELSTAAKQLTKRPEFSALGLTDAGVSLLGNEATVITTDFRLCGVIQANGGRCVNFTHWRSTCLI